MRTDLQAPPLARLGVRLDDARRLVRWIGRWRPLRVSADDALGRGHPWRISAGWDAGQRRWELRVDPGYVNGAEVLCPAQPLVELPQAALDRLVAAGGDLPAMGRALLSEHPSLPIPEMRAVGTDALALAGAGEAVPEFFLERGVSEAESLRRDGDALRRVQATAGELARQQRLLRAVDVVLNVPRPSARLDIGPGNRPTVMLALPMDPRPSLTIQSGRYLPPTEAGSVQAALAGALQDDGMDRLLIGRLWMLSPLGTAHGAAVDERWEPYGQNFVYTHLDHAYATDLDVIEPLDLGFDLPLAGGVAQATVAGLVAELQMNDAWASAFLSTARVTGRFWSI